MGRVAKYKKIKTCDPFSKKNGGRIDLESVGIWGLGDTGRKPKKRSLKAQAARKKKRRNNDDDGFDVPPEGDDFDLADLTGSLKKEKLPLELEGLAVGNNKDFIKSNATIKISTVPDSVQQEKEMCKLLKLDKQVEKKPVVAEEGRMEGESKKAFHKRVKAETRQIIKRERVERHNPEKRQRKKEFLKNKKKKKKGKVSSYNDSTDDDYNAEEGSALITGEQAVAARAAATEVKFGEQAERPPVFRQLPRGAMKKAEKTTTKGTMSSEDVEAERAEMEKMRRKVQAQYAVIRQKRKGEFHL